MKNYNLATRFFHYATFLKRFLFACVVLAQMVFAFDMVEVLNDDIVLHKAGYLISNKKLSSQEALELSKTEALTPLPKGAKSFGFDHREYWFIFEISTPSSKHYFIDSKDYFGNFYDLFVYRDTQLLRHEKSGFYLPRAEKAIQTFSSRFALETQAEHTTYLLKVDSIFMRLTAFSLGEEIRIEKDWTLLLITLLVSIAVSFAFLIYNIVLFFFTKDKLFLLYVVYMFGFALVSQLSLGYVPFLLGFEGKTTIITLIFALTMYTFGLAFFTVYFLNLHQNYHVSTKIFLSLFVINAFLTPFHFFPGIIPYSQDLWLTTLQLFQSFAIFIGIKRYFEGFKPALYYLVATGGGLFFGFCFATLIGVDGIPYSLLTLNFPNMGLIWDLVMFSLAIAYRIKILTKDNIEKERLLILQSRQKSIGELTSNIAHQWKQPITELGAILTHMEAKAKYTELSKEEILEKLTLTQPILQHLSQTVTTFQNFFQSKPSKKPFNVEQTLHNCIAFVRESMAFHNIAISLHVAQNVFLKGDENALFQAVHNILLNAKDALLETQKGKKWIRIELTCKENSAHICIENNGGNIAIKPIEKVFELFMSDKSGGTGMGLFIAKMLVETQLNGKILVQNTDDGVCFRLDLKA